MRIITGYTLDYTYVEDLIASVKALGYEINAYVFDTDTSIYQQKANLILAQAEKSTILWLDADCILLKKLPEFDMSDINLPMSSDSFCVFVPIGKIEHLVQWVNHKETSRSDGYSCSEIFGKMGWAIPRIKDIDDPRSPCTNPWLSHRRLGSSHQQQSKFTPSPTRPATCCGG